MNKLIKKVIICTATITCSLVSTSTISYANNNSSINPQTIHIEDKIITYKTNDNLKCSYDLDTGKFKIDGIGSVVITTKDGNVVVNCSNNNILLKDSEWFHDNRVWG